MLDVAALLISLTADFSPPAQRRQLGGAARNGPAPFERDLASRREDPDLGGRQGGDRLGQGLTLGHVVRRLAGHPSPA
jgi:hypothetical protein